MAVLLIDPATGVEVSVSLDRALALGWPTSDGKPLHAPEAEEAAPEEAVEPVKASKPRKSPAKSAKAKAASESEAAETW